MKMGDGDQAAAKPGFSSEDTPYQKPKTQRIWPTIFLKMGDYPPHSKKWGDASPPVPPVVEPLGAGSTLQISRPQGQPPGTGGGWLSPHLLPLNYRPVSSADHWPTSRRPSSDRTEHSQEFRQRLAEKSPENPGL